MSSAEEKWAQLTDNQQATLLDSYRNTNMRYERWWKPTLSSLKEQMSAYGLAIAQVHFSGLWREANGVTFDGRVQDWGKFLVAIGVEQSRAEYLGKVAHEADCKLNWHTPTGRALVDDVAFVASLDVPNPYHPKKDALRHAAWQAIEPDGGLIKPMFNTMVEYIKERMMEFYPVINAAYQRVTSDEEVKRYIFQYRESEIDKLLA